MKPTNKELRTLLGFAPGQKDPYTSHTKVKVLPSISPDWEILVFKNYEGEFWGQSLNQGALSLTVW